MNIKKEIQEFVGVTSQEMADRELFLKFIDNFDDVLTRENQFGHISSSAYVLNESGDKILLVYHNLYEGYIFPGGHADGDTDLLGVALREVEEETGVKVRTITEDIFTIWTCPVKAHMKRGQFIPAHVHYDVDFLCEADDSLPLRIKPDENKNVIWAPISEIGKSIKLVDFFLPEFEKFLIRLDEYGY